MPNEKDGHASKTHPLVLGLLLTLFVHAVYQMNPQDISDVLRAVGKLLIPALGVAFFVWIDRLHIDDSHDL